MDVHGLHPIWHRFVYFSKKNEKISISKCANLVEIHPKEHAAVITTESTKYGRMPMHTSPGFINKYGKQYLIFLLIQNSAQLCVALSHKNDFARHCTYSLNPKWKSRAFVSFSHPFLASLEENVVAIINMTEWSLLCCQSNREWHECIPCRRNEAIIFASSVLLWKDPPLAG